MIGTGHVVGEKYRLEEKVGEGGMATVWRATHTHLDRDVAVKFLTRTASRNDGSYERFLEEAKLAASVRHRNVVDIVDFGVAEDGRPYMVLEYMHGESLADRMERQPPLTVEEIVTIVALALGGLAAVHDQGIVHRDLKPENLFLTSDADGTYPKLLDFGISKDVERSETGERRVKTRDGVILGTPQYMSPEQARGVPDLDRRSDLYSVGILLYEMLSGVRPFEAENVGDALIRVIMGEYQPLVELRPDLPPALIEVVETALSREREARFPDARTMRAALLASIGMTQTPSLTSVQEPLRSVSLDLDLVLASAVAPKTPARVVTQAPTPDASTAAQAASPPAPASESAPRVSEPAPAGPGGRIFLASMVLLGLGVVGLELRSPGTLASQGRRWLAVLDANEGASTASAEGALGDGGFGVGAGVDADTIHVRLRSVPDDATLVLDGRTYSPERLHAMREPDGGLIDIALPKQAKPFEIRVEAPGFLPFEGRRWAIEDVSYRIHLDPVPEDAGVGAAADAAAGEAPAPAVEPADDPPPARAHRSSRRRRRPR